MLHLVVFSFLPAFCSIKSYVSLSGPSKCGPQYTSITWMDLKLNLLFSFQLQQSDLDGLDPNFKRFRIENGDSLAEKEEVSRNVDRILIKGKTAKTNLKPIVGRRS